MGSAGSAKVAQSRAGYHVRVMLPYDNAGAGPTRVQLLVNEA